ncbi:putative ATP-dependent zinc protease [Halanaeroarchaeum sulfurireducens]|uniref:Alpha-L-glutamate ligase, RimK family n=1 Tax=Halanaeroarchaeum sulfurireducens TaxID=1604004 RepID=A0A0F7PFF3_9EURY|nr:RimK/LysX family protein [Halanaeroarchaeum sulfurireducens]AKH98053.1 alpha-L-glutamate ligase, RimK family [Halanaeroarchaeum sulfurireducens]ALG82447.1 alpha-L-glutamate ligase, RimK family [Halanaeroarchaeum sulfurireducens]
MDRSVSVGVLSLHSSKETKAIINTVNDLGHEGIWLRENNLVVDIENNHVTIEPDVDVIVNRLLLSKTEQPSELLGLAKSLARLRPTLNRPENVLTAFHKFATATAMADTDVRIPDAVLALDAERLNAERTTFSDEVVYKTAIGTHGGGTWKIGVGEEVNPRVGDRFAFLQELIDQSDGPHSDLRVYIVDDEIVAAMNRYAPDNDWRTNVALGGDVEGVETVPEAAADMALEAVEILGLEYAGVDLIKGSDGWYLLEVNPTAGFKGLFTATGVSPAAHIAQLAIETGGGSVDAEEVERLAGVLDDSMPPSVGSMPASTERDRTVIGYIEDVLVSGTSGTERVRSKSDTGASRTSIDTSLAATIGAGPIKSMTKVKTGSHKAGKSRPIVDIVVGVGGDRHTVQASLEDRSHMEYPLLLGRDILQDYQVDVRRQSGKEVTDVTTEEE